MRDLMQEIWATLSHNKLRTSLTGFAVAWGIFMLIALLGAGNGLLNAMMNNDNDAMSNSMMIFSGQMSKPYKGLKEGTNIWFTDKDVETTKSSLFSNNIDEVSPMAFLNDTLSYGDQHLATNLIGVGPAYTKVDKINIKCGRFLDQIDEDQSRKVLVIDSKTASTLLGNDDNYQKLLGQYVTFNNLAFRVVGISAADQSSMNQDIFAPYSLVNKLDSNNSYIDRLMFTFHGLETLKENEDFEHRYTSAINAIHGAAPDDYNTVYIWNRFTQNLQMNKGVKIMRTALWIIGLFTLLSGIVGVSNIMLISVKERTHEFGIRKAIGAKPSSILWLIIAESVAITAFFGFIGMLFGLGANQLMDMTLGHNPVDIGITQINVFLNPTVGIDVAIKALITLIVAGTIAGLVPARKASRVRPIEALRAE